MPKIAGFPRYGLALAAGAGLMLALATTAPASARRFITLYSFCSAANCADGENPYAGLVLDELGNLYGTTKLGGVNDTESNNGTVFELNRHKVETVLYSFCSVTDCADGANPLAGLIRDASGNLYGTTYGGGGPLNAGTVFELTRDGVERVLHSFCSATNCADGATPIGRLVMDDNGNLFGTTNAGGTENGGTVFKVTGGGVERVLYSFCRVANCADGENPQAGVIIDKSGNLYGTTVNGGANNGGTVFEVTSAGVERVLYSFCRLTNCADGLAPISGLVMDESGNLFGTTFEPVSVLFEVTADGAERILYSFCSAANCTDGAHPIGGLVMGQRGNFYGVTSEGGAADSGTVFKVRRDGTETVLHSFCSRPQCADGAAPLDGLVMDKRGNLYGTTSLGANNHGTVFELKKQ